MLPILDDVVGLMVSGSGPVSSGMAGMSAMDGTGDGVGDYISGNGLKSRLNFFPLFACGSSSICSLSMFFFCGFLCFFIFFFFFFFLCFIPVFYVYFNFISYVLFLCFYSGLLCLFMFYFYVLFRSLYLFLFYF